MHSRRRDRTQLALSLPPPMASSCTEQPCCARRRHRRHPTAAQVPPASHLRPRRRGTPCRGIFGPPSFFPSNPSPPTVFRRFVLLPLGSLAHEVRRPPQGLSCTHVNGGVGWRTTRGHVRRSRRSPSLCCPVLPYTALCGPAAPFCAYLSFHGAGVGPK